MAGIASRAAGGCSAIDLQRRLAELLLTHADATRRVFDGQHGYGGRGGRGTWGPLARPRSS